MNDDISRILHFLVVGLRRRIPGFTVSVLRSIEERKPGPASQVQPSACLTSPHLRCGTRGLVQSRAPRVTWVAAPPRLSPSPAAAPEAAAPARSQARCAARSAVGAARTARGRRMALRGLAGSGPGSRGPADEAVATDEEREASALVAAGAVSEEDEEDEGRGRGLLRWDGFSAWLHCVCVVGFDLELGQAVEVRPSRTLTPCATRVPAPGRSQQSVWLAGRPAWTRADAHPGVAGRPSASILGCGPELVPLGGSWAVARGEKFSLGPF